MDARTHNLLTELHQVLKRFSQENEDDPTRAGAASGLRAHAADLRNRLDARLRRNLDAHLDAALAFSEWRSLKKTPGCLGCITPGADHGRMANGDHVRCKHAAKHEIVRLADFLREHYPKAIEGSAVDTAMKLLTLTKIPADRPSFNHTRESCPFSPCPECAPLMLPGELAVVLADTRREMADLRAELDAAKARWKALSTAGETLREPPKDDSARPRMEVEALADMLASFSHVEMFVSSATFSEWQSILSAACSTGVPGLGGLSALFLRSNKGTYVERHTFLEWAERMRTALREVLPERSKGDLKDLHGEFLALSRLPVPRWATRVTRERWAATLAESSMRESKIAKDLLAEAALPRSESWGAVQCTADDFASWALVIGPSLGQLTFHRNDAPNAKETA